MPRDTPYAGVASLWRSALERGEQPEVFEDGGQLRDFVHADDVAAANALAVGHRPPAGTLAAYNICSGHPVTILEVAAAIASTRGVTPVVTGDYRLGDVRHVVASPDRARDDLGFTARTRPEQGLRGFATDPLRD